MEGRIRQYGHHYNAPASGNQRTIVLLPWGDFSFVVIIASRVFNGNEEEKMAPKTIKGKTTLPEFITDLDVDVIDDQYEAYDKDLPDGLPETTKNGEHIAWFNNFGVRRKNGIKEKTVPQYRVFLQQLPQGKKLCAYYDNTVNDVPVREAGPGRVVFTLNVGDPPNGIYP